MENRKKILCVGNCVLDIIHVVAEYPAEDSDKRSNHGRWQRGGNASNNCTVLSNLSAPCEFLGTFSTTEMFQFVIQDLHNRNIEIKNCVFYENCEAPLSSVLLSEKTGTRTIIHSNVNLPSLLYNDFKKCNLGEYDWIHFEARSPNEVKIMIQEIQSFNQSLRAKDDKITISLDLEKPRADLLELGKLVDYIFLGRDYSLMLKCDDMKSAVYKLRDEIKISNTIICPWGSAGVAVLDNENNFFTCPSFPPKTVIDTLGAGDTFCAATIYALSKGIHLKKSIEFGSRIAGAKVGFYGYDKIKEIDIKNLMLT